MMYDQYTGSSLVSIMHQQQHIHQQQQHPQQHHHHQQQQHHQHQQHQQQQHHQQQQQQNHHEQQQQQFMADTERWLNDDGQMEFMPKVVQRRAKRIIPDTEKDDKYWEKRKRNNMAAKRSRENKRLMENDIRHKVTYLEEQNALMRKEISVIKTRYGIPTEQSLLTPEERAQCMQEVKSAQEASEARRTKESEGSGDDVSSTSPSVYPIGLHQGLEDNDVGRRSSIDTSSNSPKLKENSLNTDSSYGPSAYGPFNPPPTWGPTGAADIQSFQGSPSTQDFSPPAGRQTKLPPISNAFQEKSESPFNRYMNNGGLAGYNRPPYDYYMQYATQGNQMLYGNNDGALTGAAPADLSTKRCKREDDQRPGSSGSGSGTRNLMNSIKATGLPDTVSNSIPNSVAASLCLDDVAAMASTLGQVPRNQEQFSRLNLPTQVNSSSMAGHSLPAEAAHTASTGGIKGPEQEVLKRENDALKIAVRTLTAQVEHMKDQVFKD